MITKLEDFLEEVCERTTKNNQYPVLTSSKNGIFLQDSYFNKQIASKNNTGYKIIRRGDFTYRVMSDTGEFFPNMLECTGIGIVSPAYPVFHIVKDIVLSDYLKYYFKSASFQKAITSFIQGSTRASMKFSKMKTISINLPAKAAQSQIVKQLNLVETVIGSKSKELEFLDNLVKARFVEMFGVPGTDPFKYGMSELGKCCELNPQKTQDRRLLPAIDVSFVPMASVSEHGDIDTTTTRAYKEVKKGFTYFAENDVLFAKITPCMENGKGAIAKGLKNELGFGSTEFHVLRPIKGISNSHWIYTLTSFKSFRKNAESSMTGSAGQRRTPISFLNKYKIALPPIARQEQFAGFVALVDKTKFSAQESLRQAQLLFDSLMQEYFG